MARARTRRLAVLAGAATLALVAGEVVYARRRGHVHRPPGARETVEVVRAGYRSGSADETAVLNLFLAFGVTFGVARGVTHAIRRGVGPFGNIRMGRRHIHHFVPGILLAFAAGGAGLVTRSETLEQTLAVPFGAGIGLTFDEAALLLDLRDVYWTREGILSVQLSLGVAAILGATILALRMLRRGERLVEERGEIPLL